MSWCQKGFRSSARTKPSDFHPNNAWHMILCNIHDHGYSVTSVKNYVPERLSLPLAFLTGGFVFSWRQHSICIYASKPYETWQRPVDQSMINVPCWPLNDFFSTLRYPFFITKLQQLIWRFRARISSVKMYHVGMAIHLSVIRYLYFEQ